MKKRPKKLPVTTPRSVIKHALRLLWLRSRERLAALKRDDYTCQGCHKKQSKAKGKEFAVEVHHIRQEIDWDGICEYLYRNLLVDHSKLTTLCRECHLQEHADMAKK
jgi:5-methylcytosine-specific restriction endonuclease McrA